MTNSSIVVVGMGCLFPDAPDVSTYWKNLIEGHCAIRPLPEARWASRLYQSETRGTGDQAYSRYAGFIDDGTLEAVARAFSLDFKRTPRMELMALGAASQAMAGLPLKDERGFLSMGCMGADDGISLFEMQKEKDSLLRHADRWEDSARAREVIQSTMKRLAGETRDPRRLTLPSSILHSLQSHLGVKGEACLVDAACASSLAAVEVALRYLHSGEVDYAVVGGMESQLAPENFILFCHLGLHAEQVTRPLDAQTDGLNQGEGAGVVVLMPESRAKALGITPLARLKGCGGSSNGQSASLFSPTVEGQQLALERANPQREVYDYLECHATGTEVGDTTELKAVDGFFADASEPIPVGSVKGRIGHTKGAAGMAGLIKGLLSLQHRVAPPSPYFTQFVGGLKPSHVFVNPAPEPFATGERAPRVGVSSAGFGGTNYHVVLEGAEGELASPSSPGEKEEPTLLVRHTRLQSDGVREWFNAYRFPLPPNHLAQIDELQLTALAAVQETLDRAGIQAEQLRGPRTSVLSASILGIEAYTSLARRARHYELGWELGEDEQPLFQFLVEHREKFPPVTEDSGPGTLNNVIAGRVANLFDFKGSNFNVDADHHSLPMALKIAHLELGARKVDWVWVLGVDEEWSEDGIVRRGIQCYLLSRPAITEALGVRTQAKLDEIWFEPSLEGSAG